MTTDIALLTVISCILTGLFIGFVSGIKVGFKRAMLVIDYACLKAAEQIGEMEYDDYVFWRSRTEEERRKEERKGRRVD